MTRQIVLRPAKQYVDRRQLLVDNQDYSSRDGTIYTQPFLQTIIGIRILKGKLPQITEKISDFQTHQKFAIKAIFSKNLYEISVHSPPFLDWVEQWTFQIVSSLGRRKRRREEKLCRSRTLQVTGA
ncbi:hypothetical protein Fot_41846 [Forsythia ovata]|uniref:Uncharacterized protein n=1 Tax=Forsythia ovata TaxID=205694 RepID=A0ABD1RJI3_9LAMI